MVFLVIGIGFFVKAHQASGYTATKAKPNSLVYLLNADTNKAHWATYDTNLDEWTKTYLGEKPKEGSALNSVKLYSKYGSQYAFMADAPLQNIPKPTIEFLRDTIKGNQHVYKIRITSNRPVNRYDIFVTNAVQINNFRANGVESVDFESNIASKTSGKLLTYYVVDRLPLEMEFSISKNKKLDLELLESSFDLLSNPLVKVIPRKSGMIPMPFVLTDAVIIRQKIKPTPKSPHEIMARRDNYQKPDTSTVAVDSIKQ